jgi:hypothetical protein
VCKPARHPWKAWFHAVTVGLRERNNFHSLRARLLEELPLGASQHSTTIADRTAIRARLLSMASKLPVWRTDWARRHLRLLLNVWPPLLFAGIRVTRLDPAFAPPTWNCASIGGTAITLAHTLAGPCSP